MLLTTFDGDTFPLGYYSLVEGRRPDVQLLQAKGFVYGQRLYATSLSNTGKREVLTNFVGNTKRPVFFLLEIDYDILPLDRKGQHLGFYMQLIERQGVGAISVTRNPRGEEYFHYLLDRRPANRWERVIREVLLEHYCHYLALMKLSSPPAHVQEAMRGLYASVGRNLHCVVGISSVLLGLGDAAHWPQLEQWLKQAEALRHEAAFQQDVARIYYLRGNLAERQGRKKLAMDSYLRSSRMDPRPENKAVEADIRLRRAERERGKSPPSLGTPPLSP